MTDQHVGFDARGALEDERAHLRVQLTELSADADESLDFDENFADSGQVAAEQGENRALAGSLQEQLDDVDNALDRLRNGSYGLCVTCGKPIQPERLEAMPASSDCINCA